MAKPRLDAPVKFYQGLIQQIKTNKTAFTIFVILRLAVIAVLIRCIITERYESVFTAALALILFLIPPFIEKNFRLELPTTLETLAFIFIFCAEILGEIEGFYIKYAFWDTMLHATNGFMFAAFGFCLIDMLNRNPKTKFQLSPAYVALTAFCFSMTIGVLWEFYEFGVDKILNTDMQKDTIVNAFNSVHPSIGGNSFNNITKTTIEYSGKSMIIENGYLDIGLTDTIKDMFVNLIGAVIFSIIGYFYIRHRGKGKIASQFIPVILDKDAKKDAKEGKLAEETENSPSDEKNVILDTENIISDTEIVSDTEPVISDDENTVQNNAPDVSNAENNQNEN